MRKISRRQFLKHSVGLAGRFVCVPHIIPSSASGGNATMPPSERITLGLIGCGDRGLYDLTHFLIESDVQCLAVCDCWESRREKAKSIVDTHHNNTDCTAHRFHEELLARKDIDAILIATGDRWHAVISILAARTGKDIYCEKPYCLTIAEGRILVETTRRYGTIWQCGTQRRSNRSYAFVINSVRRGLIGKLHTITTSFGRWSGNAFARPEPIPSGFDYDRWLGQAPWAPYSPVRVGLWRNHWDTGAGPIADMGPHFFDIAQAAHDTEYSGPVEFEGQGQFPTDGFANVPFNINVNARYSDDVMIQMNSDSKGVRFDGNEGWIHIDDFGNITPRKVLADLRVSGVGYKYMAGHIRNFLDCIRLRRQPASHPEISHRSHTIAHCANICLRLGRKLQWDPQAERFTNDEHANRMLARTMRIPWCL